MRLNAAHAVGEAGEHALEIAEHATAILGPALSIIALGKNLFEVHHLKAEVKENQEELEKLRQQWPTAAGMPPKPLPPTPQPPAGLPSGPAPSFSPPVLPPKPAPKPLPPVPAKPAGAAAPAGVGPAATPKPSVPAGTKPLDAKDPAVAPNNVSEARCWSGACRLGGKGRREGFVDDRERRRSGPHISRAR